MGGGISHTAGRVTRVLSGDTAEARTVYQGLFALRRNADSDIPILADQINRRNRLPSSARFVRFSKQEKYVSIILLTKCKKVT